MNIRRKLVRVLLGTALALFAVLTVSAVWLLGTESGLARLLALAAGAPDLAITAHGVHGTLAGGFAIDELVIDHERVRVVAHGLRARLDPFGLPIVRLRLPSLAAQDVLVVTRPAVRPPDHVPVSFMPGPLRLLVDRLTVATLEIRAPAGGQVRFTQIATTIELTRSRIVSTQLHADGGPYLVDGRATLVSGDPLGLEANVAFMVAADGRHLGGSATAAGTLATLSVVASTLTPRGADFAGTLSLVDVPRVDGRLALDRLDPESLGLATGTLIGELTGALDVRGTLDNFTIDGRVAAAGLPIGPVAMTATGGYEGESLRLDQLSASTATAGNPPSRVRARGRIGLAAPAQVALQGDWSGLRWPIAARSPLLTSPSGTFRITGGAPFRYQLTAALAGPQLPISALEAQGTLDGARLTVRSFDARIAAGRATGNAALDFAAPRPWHVELSGRGIDPGAFRAPLKGRVNFDLLAEGEGFAAFGHWDAHLVRLDGTVRGLPARGGGAITVRGRELHFDNVKLAFGSAELDAGGTLGTDAGFHWRLSVGRLGDFLAGASGSVRSQGVLSGDLAHLEGKATLGARALGFGEWRAAEVTAETDFDATDRRPSFLKLAVLQPAHGTSRADQLLVALDGRASAHTLGVKLTSGEEYGELATHGAYRDGVWTLQLESLRVSGRPLLAYRLAEPSTMVVSRDAASLTKSCVVREESSICTQGTWSSARPWAGSLDAVALPLRVTGIGPQKDMAFGGSVSAHVAARGAPGQAWTGEGVLELADAEFRYRAPNGRMEQVRVDRGRATLHADPRAYSGAADVTTVGGSTIAASVRVGRSDEPLAQAPVSGTFAMATSELGALPVFIPGVDRMAGRLETDLKFSGTAAAPLLAGTAHLTSGEIDIHRTNLLLRTIDAQVAIDGDVLTLSGSATTRGGTATAAGRFHWTQRAPAGELDFTGERLLVADLPEVKIVASPRLHFTVDHKRITVRGDVTIPSGRIAPRDLRNAVIASGDERIVDEDAAPPTSALIVDSDVRLVLGDDVAIDAYGLTGKLGGNLLVTAHGGEVAYGSGELNVREGKYKIYSRELDIDRGRLLFAGQSLGDPGIDVRAQRLIDTTTAGINVRGTLRRPQITFYSEPPMSQSQIAAMLVLGVTLEDVQAQNKAAGSTAGGGNTGMSVSLGKFLTPKLYVSYGVSLTEAINTLKLRYTIGDRWVIRTESGVQQSVDIEYTIGR